MCSTLLVIGFQTLVIGLLGDLISANRKILEDVQFRVKKLEYGELAEQVEKTERAMDQVAVGNQEEQACTKER